MKLKMKLMKMMYLCIPGTSVPSERVFSTAGDIVCSERSVLSPEHVDQLIYISTDIKCPKICGLFLFN